MIKRINKENLTLITSIDELKKGDIISKIEISKTGYYEYFKSYKIDHITPKRGTVVTNKGNIVINSLATYYIYNDKLKEEEERMEKYAKHIGSAISIAKMFGENSNKIIKDKFAELSDESIEKFSEIMATNIKFVNDVLNDKIK